MPRLVRIAERTPLVLQTTEGEVRICRCGLSKKGVYCDDACKLTEGEDETLTYEYDAKGKRKVLGQKNDDKQTFSKAWKWILPVAYILIPANVIATVTGYMKLPAKYAMKGKVPGLPDTILDKTPYGFLFPVLLQIGCVVFITWLSMHPQYANPHKLMEMVDTKVTQSMRDRFNLWVRRLLALIALLASAFFTYISLAIIFSALAGEDSIMLPVVLGFALALAAVIAAWTYFARRHFRSLALPVAAAPSAPPPASPPNAAPPA